MSVLGNIADRHCCLAVLSIAGFAELLDQWSCQCFVREMAVAVVGVEEV